MKTNLDSIYIENWNNFIKLYCVVISIDPQKYVAEKSAQSKILSRCKRGSHVCCLGCHLELAALNAIKNNNS